ncbi:MAG: DUF4928 family protein [Thermoguttaceae bacterium]|jgi:hypothetical protein
MYATLDSIYYELFDEWLFSDPIFAFSNPYIKRLTIKAFSQIAQDNPINEWEIAESIDKVAGENIQGSNHNGIDGQRVFSSLRKFLGLQLRILRSSDVFSIYFDINATSWSWVHDILLQAKQVNKYEPISIHLVGAKLQLRFPDLQISNDGYSAADIQTGRLGDFEIGNTTFHVTIAPGPGIYEKCKSNLHEGSRVFLLVPNDCVIGARQNAELIAPDRIAVESLESFIANNIEELSVFSKESLIGGFRRLLEIYNCRVDAVELDKSMMIEIPRTLQ